MKKNKVILSLFGVLLCVISLGILASHCAPVSAFCGQSGDHVLGATTELKELAPRYFEYSDAALQQVQRSGKKVVLYFWAPWCTSCTALDVEIEKNRELIPQDVIVLRIEYDKARALRKQYNVVIQHTFVQIDAQGKTMTQWVGGEPSDLATKTK